MALAEHIQTSRVCQPFRYQRARRTDRPRIQTTDHATKVRIWHAEAHTLHKVVVAILVKGHAMLRIVVVYAILADCVHLDFICLELRNGRRVDLQLVCGRSVGSRTSFLELEEFFVWYFSWLVHALPPMSYVGLPTSCVTAPAVLVSAMVAVLVNAPDSL